MANHAANSFKHLSDEGLLETLVTALGLQMDREFLLILYEEVCRRNINLQDHIRGKFQAKTDPIFVDRAG